VFLFEMRSGIEGVLSLAAVPLSVYVGYLLLSGRDSLFVLTRAVAIMGAIYLPFETIPVVRQWLIEVVTRQTYAGITALGYQPEVAAGPDYGYQSALVFVEDGHRYRTYIEMACTGIGSMAIFGGLIAAVRAPLRNKLTALAITIPTIYVLNIVRNVFIAVAFGDQWFQWFVPQVMALTGYEQPGLVSFFIADRVISQALSVVVLVVLAWATVRQMPSLFVVVEDVIFVATGREYDLQSAFEGGPARADGR
jgi:archaeosortase A (PGF-CTERM-specific)